MVQVFVSLSLIFQWLFCSSTLFSFVGQGPRHVATATHSSSRRHRLPHRRVATATPRPKCSPLRPHPPPPGSKGGWPRLHPRGTVLELILVSHLLPRSRVDATDPNSHPTRTATRVRVPDDDDDGLLQPKPTTTTTTIQQQEQQRQRDGNDNNDNATTTTMTTT